MLYVFEAFFVCCAFILEHLYIHTQHFIFFLFWLSYLMKSWTVQAIGLLLIYCDMLFTRYCAIISPETFYYPLFQYT